MKILAVLLPWFHFDKLPESHLNVFKGASAASIRESPQELHGVPTTTSLTSTLSANQFRKMVAEVSRVPQQSSEGSKYQEQVSMVEHIRIGLS